MLTRGMFGNGCVEITYILNTGKTECVLIGFRHNTKHSDTQLRLDSENLMIRKVKSTKVLGVKLDENLNWEKTI